MQNFVVSPSDGFAGALNRAERTVRLVLPASQNGRTVSASNYFSRFPDSVVLEVADDSNGIEQFSQYEDFGHTLDFTLLLLDPGLRDQTRTDVARELNELLACGACLDYVLDILLAAPLSLDADIAGAAVAAKQYQRTQLLVETLIESQTRVRFAYEAWLSIRNNEFTKKSGVDSIYGILINHGVFRKLVLDGRTYQDKSAAVTSVVLGLQDVCVPRITSKLVNEYFSNFPDMRIAQSLDITLESDSVEPVAIARHRNIGGADAKLARVESQIERIAELFGQGNDQQANEILNQLVDSQSQSTSDHSHVVKSLCNIATRCDIRGRRDVSFQCLSTALTFHEGVDSILYLQIGNAFRTIRKFDEALTCYDNALKHDRGECRDTIELEIIRVSEKKGDYQKALEQLINRVATAAYRPTWLTYIGTLYRKMGDLRKARGYYWDSLQTDPAFHSAYAGLAESNKQSGRHFKAIARYKSLLREFPDLEEGAIKVYQLALGFLFRLTRQPSEALEILTHLNTVYPSDPDVHLQLAKAYMLEGETARARGHFERAKGPNLEQIAAGLFLIADGQISALQTQDTTDLPPVLPENKSLARCIGAMAAIDQSDFVQARRILDRPVHVDRLHADFETTLGFHARKKLDNTFDYKSDYVIARIAKRGYPELRQSIAAIADGNFAVATKLEMQMCLLIA